MLYKYLAKETGCKENIIKNILTTFKFEFKTKWEAAKRNEVYFRDKFSVWLQGTVKIPTIVKKLPGRPIKSFQQSCEASKRKKTMALREKTDVEQLVYATQMSLRSAGNPKASNILKEISKSPQQAKKFSEAAKERPVRMLTGEEALSVFMEANLSKRTYEVIRRADPEKFPPYSEVSKAKKLCYPDQEKSWRVTCSTAEVRLQELLNHTILRLFKYIEDVLAILSEEERSKLRLISKWGCDGSQQMQYHQKFQNDYDSDANIFQSSFVPIRLVAKSHNCEKIIWQNPVPSSPLFCRPIRIRYIHETNDVTREEIDYVKSQINSLDKFTFQLEKSGLEVSITHTLLLTMVDGKVCNAATENTSSMRCYICGLTSKYFNKLERKAENVDAMEFGLSTLHARIRFFEFILHLSYKLPLKKWQVRGQEEKQILENRKKHIQKKFKERLGLRVDFTKPGYGNSNDGNTSRRVFANPEVAAELLEVDLDLVKRFATILEVISCGLPVDTDKFGAFASETAELYVSLYSWLPMSPTVHKILIHGPSVISNAILPIGQLSEEAAEARNKHFRQYRLNFSRKSSREDCNYDVLGRLLVSSDPYITCGRLVKHKKRTPISPKALELLAPENMNKTYVIMKRNRLDEPNNDDSCDEDDTEDYVSL